MLVLTRKYQEKIRIGNNITITVLRTKGKAVRLGIEAPADVPVIRGELSFEATGAGVESVEEELVSCELAASRCASNRLPTSSWEANSSPAGKHARMPKAKVELQKVPRSKVAEILPSLINGAAPLRAARTTT
jgi:carbon storage regulator CsrA